MTAAALLPDNAAAFEKALAAAMTDELPVPIADILDPDTTPSEWLPFLAAHESVDLWFDDWPDARKRAMIKDALALSAIKGTHEAAVRFLDYVDATVIDTVAYPARFVFGQSAIGISPINHPAFKARYLVKVLLKRPFNAFEIGRSAMGQAALRSPDLEPIRRAKQALAISKAPESEYVVSFGWRRAATFGDAIGFANAINFGGYVDRTRLQGTS